MTVVAAHGVISIDTSEHLSVDTVDDLLYLARELEDLIVNRNGNRPSMSCLTNHIIELHELAEALREKLEALSR